MNEVEAMRRHAKRQGKQVCTDFILVDDKKKPQEVVRILDSDPVRKLFNRGSLTEEQFQAAERFYSDWFIGGLNPQTVKQIKPRTIDEGHKTDYENYRQLDAKKRYFEAYDYIQSKKVRDVVEAIVINCLNVKIVSSHFFPNRSLIQSQGKVVDRLQIGLETLNDFYSISSKR